MEVCIQMAGLGSRYVDLPQGGTVADLLSAAGDAWATDPNLLRLVHGADVFDSGDSRAPLSAASIEAGATLHAMPSRCAVAAAELRERGLSTDTASITQALVDICSNQGVQGVPQHEEDELVPLLLQAGADSNTISYGRAVLFTAAQQGRDAACRSLLRHNAHPDAIDATTGMTALQAAAAQGFSRAIPVLLEHGADPHLRSKRGLAALHVACARRQLGAAEALLSGGAAVDFPSSTQKTPLQMAASVGAAQIVRLLLDFGADPTVCDSGQRTPLHLAAGNSHDEVVAVLVDRFGLGVVAQRDGRGMTALHHAARRGCSGAISYLLRAGCPPNAKAGPGSFTALHLAAHEGMFGAAHALLQGGASLEVPAGNGCTALQVAAMKGHPETLHLLTNYRQARAGR